VAVAAAALAGCERPSPFAQANRLAKAYAPGDVVLAIDEGSERRHDHSDGTYTVCGVARVARKGSGVVEEADQPQRFLVNVDDGDGRGYFDASAQPAAKARFEVSWSRFCGPNADDALFLKE
jgi:hypothetical protein